MCNKKDIEKMVAFDSFVRKCIKNLSIDYERVERKKWYNNTLFFDDENELINLKSYEDWTEKVFVQKKIFTVGSIHIEVNDEGIIKALETLSEEHRQIILLYYFENFTEKKIAQIFNKPEPTIHSKKVRALKLMKEAIFKDVN